MSLEKRQLGDFILEKKLGAGGMGEVYMARQISLDRVVAVKVLPKSLAAQESFIERFQREAKAAANLIHPNVIQIYQIGIDTGVPYFAMEYVEGEDLQQRMKRLKAQMAYEEAVDITAGVANALACAYERGIVHRDIKPSNIMIDRNGVVKVMDFGLAKVVTDSASNLTQSGLIMGTPNYISPEQGKGDPIDSRSDIYSLGVVFYEMITGVLPFRADTPAALIYKHAFEMPDPPTKMKDGLPPFLEEVCLRMLQKDPQHRYPNPKALLADLNEFRRNPAYYLKGGQRKGPPPYQTTGTGSLAGDRTIVDGADSISGSSTGVGSRSGSGIRDPLMSTSTMRRADTVAEEAEDPDAARKATLITVSERSGSGGFGKALAAVFVLAIAGAGAYVMKDRLFGPPAQGGGPGTAGGTGTPPASKAVLPLSKLERQLPKGTKVSIIRGVSRTDIDTFVDLHDVEPGTYTLQLVRKGYKTVSLQVDVSGSGVKPPFESLSVKFEPSDELKEAYDRGIQSLKDTPPRFHEAVRDFEFISASAPDYPGLAELLGEARRRRNELKDFHSRGEQHIKARRWDEAKRALEPIPTSYEDHSAVLGLRATCDQKLSQIHAERRSFERELGDGNFDRSRTHLENLAGLLPDGDPWLDEQDRRVKKAEGHLEAGYRAHDTKLWREAEKELSALLEISPRHREAGTRLAEVRKKLEENLTTAQVLHKRLTEADAELKAGRPELAREAARAALEADPGNVTAKRLLDDADRAIVEREVAAIFPTLDQHIRDRSLFNILNLVDASDTAAYKKLQAELEAFFAAPIEVRRSEHKNLRITVGAGPGAGGSDRATVECHWELELFFPEAERSTPRVEPLKAFSIGQNIGLKRGPGGWLITSFTQVGGPNVK